MRSTIRRKVVLPLATMGTLFAGVALAGPAGAHGYISSPPSRQALCATGAVSGCGSLQYEPQSVEAPKGSTKCSGGNAAFSVLDDESRDWPHASVGKSTTFNWTLTARHRTANWQYFIGGKKVAEFDDNNAIPNATVSHQVDLSAYSGEQTVLAVWNIGDTAMAFYNCIDVNIGGTGGGNNTPTTAPSTPTTPTTAPSTPAEQQPSPPEEPSAPQYPTGAPTTEEPTATAPDETATQAPAEGEWQSWKWYNRGEQVTYDGITYECRQSHTTLPGWEPPNVLALWLPQ